MPSKPYAILTDSACDMPYALANEVGVDILPFSLTVDGVDYTEREDFTFEEYYQLLRRCQGIPSTAHITMPRYLARFIQHAEAGVKDLLLVTINSTGSATHDAAVMAKKEYYEENPQSPMKIYIVDSHCYSMAYGWFLAEAARRLDAGEAMPAVVAWLNDVFTRVEILLGAFSLKFMKKSGRISAAAAIAGELLGIRPIITLNDGVSTVQKKVRGDAEVLPAMLAYASSHKAQTEPYLVGGTNPETVACLAALCQEAWGVPPKTTFLLGAAVATNTGPDAIAIVYMGPQRRQPDPV